jgi:glycosyltransferase involved in cell wall biosynthesis
MSKFLISIVGTRGIPARYGGFETFAQKISGIMANAGHDVTVQCDYQSYHSVSFNGVNLYFSGFTKDQHPVKYYYDGLKNAFRNSDIVIVATTFGSFFYFLNFFRKKKILTNTDGIEYNRSKWGLFQKLYIRISGILAALSSDILIADSVEIASFLKGKYPFAARKIRVIEYGAEIIETSDESVIREYGLESGNYYLVVSRLEPENNLRMITEGYLASGSRRPLIIVGNLKDSRFVKELVSSCDGTEVRFIGGIYDPSRLSALRCFCAAYIHGHSVGGTNPSLLEAMGCGNLCICHDNVFNREVTGNKQLYFEKVEALSSRIMEVEQMEISELIMFREYSRERILNYYNWDRISSQYLKLIADISG